MRRGQFYREKLERAKGFEPSTPTLATSLGGFSTVFYIAPFYDFINYY
jgi:hypothetical protein